MSNRLPVAFLLLALGAGFVLTGAVRSEPSDAPSELRLPHDTQIHWTWKFGLSFWKSESELKYAAIDESDRSLRSTGRSKPAADGESEPQVFQERDFNVFLVDVWPETVKRKWRADRPTPNLMLSGIWQLGSPVNIVIAMEAYESDIVAQVMFEDRAKALEMSTGKERKARTEHGGPTGHFKLDEALEMCDSWLPEQGLDWIGSRARLKRYKNALITVTASYLDPVEEEQLTALLNKLEYRATTLVEIVRLRNKKDQAGVS